MTEVIQTVRNLRSAKGFLSEKMAPTKAEGSKSRMGVGRDESGETQI